MNPTVDWNNFTGNAPKAFPDTPPNGLAPQPLKLAEILEGSPRNRSEAINLVGDYSGSMSPYHETLADAAVGCAEGVIESVGPSGVENVLIGSHFLSEELQWCGKYAVLKDAKPWKGYVPNGRTPISLMFLGTMNRTLALRAALAEEGRALSGINDIFFSDFGDTTGNIEGLKAAIEAYLDYAKKHKVKITVIHTPEHDAAVVGQLKEGGASVINLADCDPKTLLKIVVATASQASIDLKKVNRR